MKDTRRLLILAFIALAVGLIAAAVALCFRPTLPLRTAVAEGAAILYYNSPAAVQTANAIHVGYVRANGVVEIASVDIDDGTVTRRVAVHDYGKPDDHAAPALWQDGDDILVATAFHSSDLFLYRMSSNGAVALICHWPGMFTYPRFDTVDGEVRLYVRNDPDRTGNLALIRRPQECTPEEIVFTTRQGTWLYATVPDGDRIAYSVWDSKVKTHTLGFINGEPVPLAPSSYEETLMWSIAGDYVTATRFTGAFECCKVGKMVAELYKDENLIFSSAPMPSPYYPTGIVLSPSGAEGLFPTVNQRIERRDLATMDILATCEQTSEINSRPQFIRGGGGSYVWMEYKPPIAGRDYVSATISLCLVR